MATRTNNAAALAQVAADCDAQSGTEVSVLTLGSADSPLASSAGSWNPALATTAGSRQAQASLTMASGSLVCPDEGVI